MKKVELEKVDILGVGVSAIDMELALATIDGWVGRGEKHYICIRDVHGVMACQNDPAYLDIHRNAGLVTPDGMPLVWLSRLKGYDQVRRVCGPDLMLELSAHSIGKGYRHYFYGGAPGVAETLAEKLHAAYPGLEVAGLYCPPFRPLTAEEDAAVIKDINDSKADIVWVGIGSPKQEYWMVDHIDKLNATALIGVGAAFDFHAGVKKRAPVWMQRSGTEWLFRLLSEPKRLWRRYLVMAPKFIFLVLRDALFRKQVN